MGTKRQPGFYLYRPGYRPAWDTGPVWRVVLLSGGEFYVTGNDMSFTEAEILQDGGEIGPRIDTEALARTAGMVGR